MARVVAYLGPPASYSHQVVLRDFPAAEGFEHEACGTIRDIFAAVRTGRAARGVVPYENSTYGAVVDTLDLLADSAEGSAVRVVGESRLAIHHALLGRPADHRDSAASASSTTSTPSTASGTSLPSLAHICHVYSHPQALGQTRAFLAARVPRAELHPTTSTSAAAAQVAAQPGSGGAAVASVAAAESSGLAVLARDIEDRKGNTTRFLTIVAAGRREEPDGGGRGLATLLLFTLDPAESKMLAGALQALVVSGAELRRLHSRPSGGRPWHLAFVAEVDGGPDDERLRRAVAELKLTDEKVRVLGSFGASGGDESV